MFINQTLFFISFQFLITWLHCISVYLTLYDFFRWRYCDSQKQANIQYVYELWYLPLTIYCREYQIPLTIRIKLVCDTSMDFDSFIDRLIYRCGYQIKMTVRRKLICDISMHFDSFINRTFYRCEYHIKVTVKKSLYAIRKYTFTIHLPMKRLSITSLWIKSRWIFSFFPKQCNTTLTRMLIYLKYVVFFSITFNIFVLYLSINVIQQILFL